MSPAPSLFTAGRIAHALALDKRGVLRILRRIPSQGKTLVPGGQMADVWSIETLPENYRNALDRLAKIRGCRNATHFLAEGLSRWKTPIPLPELNQHHVTKAVRVKKALARAIALYVNPIADISEIRHIAWEDYQKEFGVVSDRTVRRIFDRVIERDGGEESFDDVALYLDDKLSRTKTKEAVLPGLLNPHEQAVFRYLSGTTGKANKAYVSIRPEKESLPFDGSRAAAPTEHQRENRLEAFSA
jgi:hypothetical protein